MLSSTATFIRRALPVAALCGGWLVIAARADVVVSTLNGYAENQIGLGSVESFNETTGAYTNRGANFDASLAAGGYTPPALLAAGIAQGPDGSLYVSNHNTGDILHFTLGGTYLGVFATLPPDQAQQGTTPASAASLHFGPDGNLYASDRTGPNVYRFNTTGSPTQAAQVVVSGLSSGGNFAFAPNGDLYASDFGGGRVVKLSAATHTISNFVVGNFSANPGPVIPLQTPDGILIAPNGKVLVSDYYGNLVLTFDSQGNLLNQVNVPPMVSAGASNFPSGLALDRSGNVLLAVQGIDNNNSGTLLHLDTNGNLTGTNPFVASLPEASDLVIVSTQTNWNVSGGSSYGVAANWDGAAVPSSIGASAVFGNGTTHAVPAGPIAVTIGGAYTVGSLLFTNTNATSYTLAGDGLTGHGITLNNGGIGAAINVTAGSHTISAPLTLADTGGTTAYVGTSRTLTISSGIGQSGGSQSLNKAGAGVLLLTGSSTYTGGTTVSNGSLVLQSAGSNPVLAAGTTATVSYSGTLELAGTVSALGSATTNPIAIVNNSSAAAGVLVSGSSQQVGGIDGNGTTMVNAGADLTVGHIRQSALIIGGTASSPAVANIAPLISSGGHPALASDSSGLVLAGSLLSDAPFGAGAISAVSLVGSESPGPTAEFDAPLNLASGAATVPEPSAILLVLAGFCGLFGYRVLRPRRSGFSLTGRDVA